ncbi:MAG: DUF6512 family protein [Bacillota bacterium]|nr:DUF6512 family protein [Bacillota bacterium]
MEKLKQWQIAGAAFTILTGTLLHFVYGWLGEPVWAVFSPVNESTWEHLKLVFWPAVIFGAVEYVAYGRETEGFIPVKVTSVLVGMAAVVVIFYTYSGILGRNLLFMDIMVFIVSVGVAYLFSYYKIREPGGLFTASFSSSCEISVIAVISILMVIFAYDPPEIGMFQDPVTGEYGIMKK